MKTYYFTDKEDPLSLRKFILVIVAVLILVGLTYVQSNKVTAGDRAVEEVVKEQGGAVAVVEEREEGNDNVVEGEGHEEDTGSRDSEIREEDKSEERVVTVSVEEQENINTFARISGWRNKELIAELPEIIEISKKYNFDYKIVFALIAEEGGWGGSYYCIEMKQCTGYGKTDTLDYEYDYPEGTYAYGMEQTLIMAYGEYDGRTIDEMSYAGWNTRQSWRDNVGEIYGYFN